MKELIKVPQRKVYSSIYKDKQGNPLPITLTEAEKYHAEYMQRMVNARFKNALGYEIPITTLTTVMKKISEQKFFEVAPADYFAVKVGEGTWSSNLTFYRSFDASGLFEDGIINTGGANARLASADSAVDGINIPVFNWAMSIGWSIFDLELAAKSGNWDLVAAKERARKKRWDIGVQKVAFLGLLNQNGSGGSAFGLLNQPGSTVNTSVITAPIGEMSTTNLKTFCATVIEAYRTNCNRTAWPDRFVMPESDYNMCASQASPDFPIKSVLELLEETFRIITKKNDFKVLPCAYGDAAYHADAPTIAGKQVYSLHRYDEESMNMQIPLQYQNSLANSIDNFSFQNAGFGQFSPVVNLRPLEQLYFQY